MVISSMLKEIRENNGLSPYRFAEKLAIFRQAVSKRERGIAVSDIENRMYMSGIFNVSLDASIKGGKKMARKLISIIKKQKLQAEYF